MTSIANIDGMKIKRPIKQDQIDKRKLAEISQKIQKISSKFNEDKDDKTENNFSLAGIIISKFI